MPVSLLYPNRRQLAPRVQAVLNWLTQVVGPQLQGDGSRAGEQPVRHTVSDRNPGR
jgi:hypothetical protein